MTFAINQQSQGLCFVYVKERGPFGGQRVNVTNGPNGWFAQLGEVEMNERGRPTTFRAIGEPQRVSHLINRRDAAETIANLMGLT